MRSGQAEFVIIIAILLIGSVAVFFVATNPDLLSISPGSQSTVQQSVNDFIREAARDSMKKISEQGGFAQINQPSTRFAGLDINYWSGQNAPDVQENLNTLISDYVNTNKKYLQASLSEHNVSLGPATVSTSLLADKLIVKVTMPTTVADSPASPNYEITIDTLLGQSVEFSKKLLELQGKEHFFEIATMRSFLLTPLKQNQHSVPIYITHTSCTSPYVRTWDQLAADAQNSIKSTVANTYMPADVPLNTIDTRSSPKWALPIDGFIQLGISFHVPEQFSLTRTNPQNYFSFMGTGRDNIYLSSKDTQAPCISDPPYLNVLYDISYPVIAAVKDPLTNNIFFFAFPVSISQNEPSESSLAFPADGLCSRKSYPVSIATAHDASPVAGATVAFAGCYLGKTDSKGMFTGYAPWASGPLEIAAQGYEPYAKVVNTQQLSSYSAGLAKSVSLHVFVYEVNVNDDPVAKQYSIDSSPSSISGMRAGRTATLDFHSIDGTITKTLSSSTFFSLPEGIYSASGSLVDKEGKLIGSFQASQVKITPQTNELHIYIPAPSGSLRFTQDMTKDQIIKKMYKLSGIVSSCKPSIGPVLYSKYVGEGCKVSYTP